jgi:hypothetical protein
MLSLRDEKLRSTWLNVGVFRRLNSFFPFVSLASQSSNLFLVYDLFLYDTSVFKYNERGV